jgi:glutamate racemase
MIQQQPKSSLSVGVFDSGVGGLTVMREMTKLVPHENIVYFGDTARVPYGGKSVETIIRYSIENAIFLLGHNIKILVVACNTASSCAIDKLQQIFNIPVIGTIIPAAEKAIAITKNQKIAVLGTRATISSGVFQNAIKAQLPKAEVTEIACPLFVPLVEECLIEHSATKLIIKEYLAVLQKKEIDTLILGCTHYPLLRSLIAQELHKDVQIVDSAVTCAQEIKKLMENHQMQNRQSHIPEYKYFVSDDPEKFCKLGHFFLGMAINHVQAVKL